MASIFAEGTNLNFEYVTTAHRLCLKQLFGADKNPQSHLYLRQIRPVKGVCVQYFLPVFHSSIVMFLIYDSCF